MLTCPTPDALMDCYYKLALQSEIPDMKEYSDQWWILGETFSLAGRLSQAEMCYSRSRQYAQTAVSMPAVIRVREGNVVYLRQIQAAPATGIVEAERLHEAAYGARSIVRQLSGTD